jgi:hypothetical protein
VHITVERALETEVIDSLFPTYVDAWEPLLMHAAARHVLSQEEFAAEMTDERIEKYVVWGEGRALALTTLTTDMTAIPWINALYYEARYPDAAARNALFYLGYTLVDRFHRRSSALLLMADRINRRVQDASGVVGFDICDFNNAHGIGRRVARLFSASNQIEPLDTQSYYAADYRGVGALRPHRFTDSAPARPPQQERSYRVVTLAQREEFASDIPELLASRWPRFVLEGRPGHDVDLEELLLSVPEKQLLLVSEEDVLAGAALSVPLPWDGTLADLPAGWDDAITRSAEMLEHGQLANAVCALSITIAADATGKNLAAQLMTGLNRAAGAAGADALIVPVRPNRKAEYPLTPMPEYLTWTSRSGESFDPWLRLHLRAGAQLLGTCPESMTISGQVAQWEDWLGRPLPTSGSYVIDGGLVPLEVDREADLGVYREPNVWVRHTPIR